MLGSLPPELKSNWKGSIGVLLDAYSCTQNYATGFSPCFLRYGRQCQLPIDVTLRLTPKLITTPASTMYVQNWGTTLGGPIERPTCSSRWRCDAINEITINIARQCLCGQETWSWSMSPPSRADTQSTAGGRTGSMWWNGSLIQTYQYLWYIP